ncbi:hypothetical protein, partial [Mangrovibacterium diazotrophicum]|uniref:hypothetical protein n=1 Tax=Mangrovibacterium diazotrophicum TaxID=1261403 RepID=UPI001B85D8C0
VVTVEDKVAPAIECQNITVQLDETGNVSITATDVTKSASDACGIASSVIDNDTFTCDNVGPNNVELTVTDVNGNASSCTAVVTVEDKVAPAIECQNITVQADETGNVSITAADVTKSASDACGIASSVIDNDTFTCDNVGPNNVELTVTDVNGNVSSCTAVVTVEDKVAPAIECQNITVQLDETGNVSITAADVTKSASDACGIASSVIDNDTFTCDNVGPNNVELTVTDVNGNVSTCTAVVTVEDKVAPAVECQNITVQLDETGNVSITAADVTKSASDACGITSSVIDNDTFTCDNVGTNNVELTVTDVNGNVSTCTAVVTVEDKVAPAVECQNITVQLD